MAKKNNTEGLGWENAVHTGITPRKRGGSKEQKEEYIKRVIYKGWTKDKILENERQLAEIDKQESEYIGDIKMLINIMDRMTRQNAISQTSEHIAKMKIQLEKDLAKIEKYRAEYE